MSLFQRLFHIRLRDITPRGFYARSLLIMVVPIVLLLTIMTVYFFESHIRQVSRKLSQGVAGDVAYLVRQFDPKNSANLVREAEETMRMRVRLLPESDLPNAPQHSFWQGANVDILDHELSVSLTGHSYWFDLNASPSEIEIRVPIEGGLLRFRLDRDNVFSTTGHIFIVWVIALSLLLLAIALGFLRNQVRSVIELAKVAEAYGRGEDLVDFKPSGATEIRNAANAVIDMRDRISAHMEQRTSMLSAVSHDLRTPLTRLKLQLAMLPQSEDLNAARADLDEMAAMLDEYLAFARGEGGESFVETDLGDLIRFVALRFSERAEIALVLAPAIMGRIRPLALKRVISNLISNACDHASIVHITLAKDASGPVIYIDDDGPGIPPERREEAFRPFSRLDQSRNQNNSGVGLGLALVRDIARAHGGDAELSTSPHGGLRAIITLPKIEPSDAPLASNPH